MPRTGTRDFSETGTAAKPQPGKPALPAVWQPGLERHWLPVDEAGGQFISAAFGGAGNPVPRRPIPAPPPRQEPRPEPRAQPALSPGPAAPNRVRATTTLLLAVMTLLFAASLAPPMP